MQSLANTEHLSQNVLPAVAGGGGSMLVCTAFGFAQKVDVRLIRGTMNVDKYGRDTIQEILMPFIQPISPGFRMAMEIKYYLQIISLPWHRQSSDLNPTKHVRGAISRRLSDEDQSINNLTI